MKITYKKVKPMNVTGAIDGCHVNIKAPTHNSNAYINKCKKHRHNRNRQKLIQLVGGLSLNSNVN